MALNGLVESTLAEVCSLVTDGTHDTPKRVASGYPLIKAKEITGGRIDFEGCDQISEKEHLEVISRSRPEFGDTLFAHIGASLGEAAFVNTTQEFSIKNVALFKPDPAPKEKDPLPVKVASTPVSAPVTETKTAPAPTPTVNKSPALGLAAGEEVVVSTTKPKADTPAKPAAASTGSGKFILQIGAFASEDRVNGWVSKLKAQKIPNVVTTKKGADGVTLFLLRAGPFPDKDSADTAEKKVKAMGLTPRLVEVGSP